MNDQRDQTDDPLESRLRSWFKARRTPAAPPTLRAFVDQVGSGSRPTAPVRRVSLRGPQAPTDRLAAEALAIAVVVLAGAVLVVSGQRDPGGPTASPVDTGPTSTPMSIISPLPKPSGRGTCSASQMVPGTATSAYGFGTLGTTSADLTQLLRNTGGSCVMDLPGMIEVASASGPFQAVPVVNVGIVSAYNLGSGDSLAIVLSAWWWTGVRPDNGTPLPAPPCAAQINEVTRVKIPLASGSIQIDLETVWRQVCSSPASVSATFITR